MSAYDEVTASINVCPDRSPSMGITGATADAKTWHIAEPALLPLQQELILGQFNFFKVVLILKVSGR